jgi:hypothetical protein
MTKSILFAAAALFAVAAAPLAQAGEGTFQPTVTAQGFEGPRVAGAPITTRYNDGMGGDMRLGRPAASVMGTAGKAIPSYALNAGSNGNS